MSRDREREHLAEADRHIAECKTHIARQREIIQELVEAGVPPKLPGDGGRYVMGVTMTLHQTVC
jgi:hypothetical protein